MKRVHCLVIKNNWFVVIDYFMESIQENEDEIKVYHISKGYPSRTRFTYKRQIDVHDSKEEALKDAEKRNTFIKNIKMDKPYKFYEKNMVCDLTLPVFLSRRSYQNDLNNILTEDFEITVESTMNDDEAYKLSIESFYNLHGIHINQICKQLDLSYGYFRTGKFKVSLLLYIIAAFSNNNRKLMFDDFFEIIPL
jgi:hypothetical protein